MDIALTTFFNREKFSAFLVHLLISLTAFSVLLAVILLSWYPPPYFSIDGGWQGIRLIAIVDIVLGPLLTFVIFKKGKPRLWLDLSIIAAFQIVAMVSGAWIVYKEHPVLVTLTEGRLIPIPAYQAAEAGITRFDQYGKNKPPIVFVNLPDDPDQLQNVIKRAFQTGQPLYLQGEFYEPLNKQNLEKLRKYAIDMNDYLAKKIEDREKYQLFVQQHEEKSVDFIYLPLRARYQWQIAAFDPKARKLVDVLPITPPTT